MDPSSLGGGGGAGKAQSAAATASGGNQFNGPGSGGDAASNPWFILATVAIFIFGLLGFAYIAKR